MKDIKNWDKNTWLASKKYIKAFCLFVESQKKLKKDTRILDIGCGRANIISYLQKKYKFKKKPIGIDIIKHKDVKKNIKFFKLNSVKFLKKGYKFDLIIIKQSLHLMSKKDQILTLRLSASSLNQTGKLIVFSLKTKNNQLPVFSLFKKKLKKSLNQDKKILLNIKKILKLIKINYFKYNVKLKKSAYIDMIKNRYISCLLNLNDKEINSGVSEINLKYKNQIKFTDTLKCMTFTK